MIKPIETAQYPARQATDQRFEATLREAWGVWIRLLNEEHLKGVFSRNEDAKAFASKTLSGSQIGEVRKMWVIVNETAGEVYPVAGNGAKPLQGVDLDFGYRSKVLNLRNEVLARLTDEELQALGLRRS